jgi:hypothetical protein
VDFADVQIGDRIHYIDVPELVYHGVYKTVPVIIRKFQNVSDKNGFIDYVLSTFEMLRFQYIVSVLGVTTEEDNVYVLYEHIPASLDIRNILKVISMKKFH